MTAEITFHANTAAEFRGPLVSTDWLAASLGDTDLRVYDASIYLPTEGVNAHAQYCTAYIPGARFFDVDRIADSRSPLPHMAPAAHEFERLAATLDLGGNHRVVFYDHRGIYSRGARLVAAAAVRA